MSAPGRHDRGRVRPPKPRGAARHRAVGAEARSRPFENDGVTGRFGPPGTRAHGATSPVLWLPPQHLGTVTRRQYYRLRYDHEPPA